MLRMANDMLPDDACRHLFVTDLDGTLLTNDAKVSRRTAHIISDLSHRGAMITVATARTPATVDRLLQHTFTRLPAIVMTGAAMWDRRHRICVDIHPISTASSEIAISTCRKYGITPFIYTLAPDSTLDVYINGDITPREQKFIDDRLGLQLKRFHINTPEGLRTGFENNMLIFAMGEYDRLEQAADELRRNTDLAVSFYPDNYNPDAALLEILAPNVSKANAIRNLGERIGATEITVFGDNLNDLSMMSVADHAVAVANAQPHVLDRAETIIGPNNADSVAEYINDILSSY